MNLEIPEWLAERFADDPENSYLYVCGEDVKLAIWLCPGAIFEVAAEATHAALRPVAS